LPSEGGKFEENEIDNVDNLNNKYPRLIEALATCHSITHINNRLDGDPLDLKLFEFTKWDLIEPKEDEISNYDCMMPTIVRPKDTKLAVGTELGILKQFPFLSGLQRMYQLWNYEFKLFYYIVSRILYNFVF
jgi:magnesium-transporting ATPase (P-type)